MVRYVSKIGLSKCLNNSKFTIGEKWFDDYWMNYGKITITEDGEKTKQIRNLQEFVSYRGGDERLIVPKARKIGLRRRYQ